MARAPRGPARSSGASSTLSGKAARKSTQATAPVSSGSSTVSVDAAGPAATTRRTRSQSSAPSPTDAVPVQSSQTRDEPSPRRTNRSTGGKSTASRSTGGKGRGRAGGKTTTTSGKGRGKTVPAAKAPASRAKKGTGKKVPAKKNYQSIPRDNDDASVRSQSVRGYNWETEQLDLKPEDLATRLKIHPKISTNLQREGAKDRHVVFESKDMIWVCPDPTWLDDNPDDEEMDITDLPLGDWWIAQVVDCYSLDQEQEGSRALGVLRVRWCYAPTHVNQIANLHNDYKKRMNRHTFEKYEVIYSDHYDFIGIDTYAGHADGILAWLEVKGLEVDDAERVGSLANRGSKTKHGTIWMTGFGKKTYGKPGRVDAVAGYVTVDDGNREKKGNKKGSVTRSYGSSDEQDSN